MAGSDTKSALPVVSDKGNMQRFDSVVETIPSEDSYEGEIGRSLKAGGNELYEGLFRVNVLSAKTLRTRTY